MQVVQLWLVNQDDNTIYDMYYNENEFGWITQHYR